MICEMFNRMLSSLACVVLLTSVMEGIAAVLLGKRSANHSPASEIEGAFARPNGGIGK